jgi:hypothetical protein
VPVRPFAMKNAGRPSAWESEGTTRSKAAASDTNESLRMGYLRETPVQVASSARTGERDTNGTPITLTRFPLRGMKMFPAASVRPRRGSELRTTAGPLASQGPGRVDCRPQLKQKPRASHPRGPMSPTQGFSITSRWDVAGCVDGCRAALC